MQNINPNENPESQNVPQPEQPIPGAVPQAQAPEWSNLTPNEWQTLLAVPLRIGRAMISVSPSGPLGIYKESEALSNSIKDIDQQNITSPLLRELSNQLNTFAADVQNRANIFSDLTKGVLKPEEFRADALQACQQAMTILGRMSPQDAQPYKQYVYNIAMKVAEASKEGGFLGFGGKVISEKEQNFLNDLANTLGIQPS